MKYLKKLYRFIRYNHRKRLTLAIIVLTAWYRAQILLVPSAKLQKHWGASKEESSKELSSWEYRYAYTISRYVNHYADRTPWESLCLVRALTARKLLSRKQISTTLYLGVGKDENGKMIAHAWIRAGEMYVTGGNGEGYGMVAKFATVFTKE